MPSRARECGPKVRGVAGSGMTRHRVGTLDELAHGALQRVVVGGVPVCLARVGDGTVYAVSDVCSHEEVSLSEGEIWGTEVECPLHVSRFDLRTGEPVAPPAMLPIKTYPVSLENGAIYVDDQASG
jgi:3-phenylpropionate/trans-cinnamate dioxygenase ferredoxin component